MDKQKKEGKINRRNREQNGGKENRGARDERKNRRQKWITDKQENGGRDKQEEVRMEPRHGEQRYKERKDKYRIKMD